MSLYLLSQKAVDEIKGDPCQLPWGVSNGLPRSLPRMNPKKSHLKGYGEFKKSGLLSRKTAESLLVGHPSQQEILELLFESSVSTDDALALDSERIIPFEDWMKPDSPVLMVEDAEFAELIQEAGDLAALAM